MAQNARAMAARHGESSSSTRCRVSGFDPLVPFRTCETVAVDTPALAATSLILTLVLVDVRTSTSVTLNVQITILSDGISRRYCETLDQNSRDDVPASF